MISKTQGGRRFRGGEADFCQYCGFRQGGGTGLTDSQKYFIPIYFSFSD